MSVTLTFPDICKVCRLPLEGETVYIVYAGKDYAPTKPIEMTKGRKIELYRTASFHAAHAPPEGDGLARVEGDEP